MTPKKNDKALHLELPFEEALQRFAQTDPKDTPQIKPGRKKRVRRSMTALPGKGREKEGDTPR
jgi:hypothetical protein